MTIALSSGCFAGHEERIASAGVEAIELSTHPPDRLPSILAAFASAGTEILSIHTPCPNRGRGLDAGAPEEQWPFTRDALFESGAIAASAGARYVLAHAFFCADLPAGDFERMQELRRATGAQEPMAEYVRSERYLAAKARTIRNLASLLPEWRRRFPRQQIILENLNPRHGYGGIVFDDVVDVARALDGEIGICLDVGHLALAEAALGVDMSAQVAGARDLIRSVHVHQNFGGRWCIDRHWRDAAPRPGLQDVDCHLPLGVTMWRTKAGEAFVPGRENAAFEGILEGAVQYERTDGAEPVHGIVDVDRLLALVPPDAHRILELDSRYVPLDDVLAGYEAFRGAEAVA